jgi:hypothetical protein
MASAGRRPGSQAAVQNDAIVVRNLELVSGGQHISADGTFAGRRRATITMTNVDLAEMPSVAPSLSSTGGSTPRALCGHYAGAAGQRRLPGQQGASGFDETFRHGDYKGPD